MNRYSEFLWRLIPKSLRSRRFLLDEYHFDLTSFEGDISEWLSRFPISTSNVEIYFALAELFRRRGEFDKAVSVHEAILNSGLEGYSHSELTLEVAQDYYAAGVLGHAEELLIRALEDADDEISKQAFRLWLAILESEQDWEKAVALVERYGLPGSGGLRLSNLYCEYVQLEWRNKSKSELGKVLKKARRLGIGSRSELLQAELDTEQNNIVEAIQLYRDLVIKDPKRVNLVLPALKRLTLQNNTEESLSKFLVSLYARHPSVRILDLLLELNSSRSLPIPPKLEAAISEQVKEGDSFMVLNQWVKQQAIETQQAIDEILPAMQKHFLAESDDHVCVECGFHSENMVWWCPQCESWETLYSRYELRIEQEIKKAP